MRDDPRQSSRDQSLKLTRRAQWLGDSSAATRYLLPALPMNQMLAGGALRIVAKAATQPPRRLGRKGCSADTLRTASRWRLARCGLGPTRLILSAVRLASRKINDRSNCTVSRSIAGLLPAHTPPAQCAPLGRTTGFLRRSAAAGCPRQEACLSPRRSEPTTT